MFTVLYSHGKPTQLEGKVIKKTFVLIQFEILKCHITNILMYIFRKSHYDKKSILQQ